MSSGDVTVHEIERLLVELRSRDVARRVFGSDTHQYRHGQRRTESELVVFERRYRIEIPTQLREFLAVVGDGSGGPHYGVCSLDRMILDDPSKPTALHGEDGDPGDGVLVVGDEGCATDVVLVVTGPLRASVWRTWDGNVEPYAASFFDWYYRWATKKLRRLDNEALIPRVRIGMTVDELCAATGHMWNVRSTETKTCCETAEIAVQAELDGEGRVTRVRPAPFL